MNNISLFQVLNDFGFNQNQAIELTKLYDNAKLSLNGTSFASTFPPRDNYNDIALDILGLVNDTQKYFVIREGTEERWGIAPLKWMQQDVAQSLGILKKLDVYYSIPPAFKSPDAVAILGATMPRMEDRINYILKQFQENKINSNYILLLTGERYVTLDIDAPIEKLQEIAAINDKEWQKLTETDLFVYLMNNSPLKDFVENIIIIDTPQIDSQRPTTQTTIFEMIKWLEKNPNIQTISFVSNQPYVKYQEAVIRESFKIGGYNPIFEVCGDESNTQKVQPLVESVGTRIFAMAPYVLSNILDEVSDPQIITRLNETYSKQPLIFQNMEQIFLHYHPNLAGEISVIESDL